MLIISYPPSPRCDVEDCWEPAHEKPMGFDRNLCPAHTGEAVAQELLDDFMDALDADRGGQGE